MNGILFVVLSAFKNRLNKLNSIISSQKHCFSYSMINRFQKEQFSLELPAEALIPVSLNCIEVKVENRYRNISGNKQKKLSAWDDTT